MFSNSVYMQESLFHVESNIMEPKKVFMSNYLYIIMIANSDAKANVIISQAKTFPICKWPVYYQHCTHPHLAQ